VTKISQLSDIGANLAAGDEFIIRDVSDASTPNKKVTSSGFIDYVIAQGSVAGFTQIAAGVGPLSRVLASSSGTTGTLTFSTAAATTLIERARITSAGNVGIGSTTFAATSKLQVFSDAGGRSVFRHASGDGGVTIAGSQASSGSSLIFGNTWDTEDGANFVEEYRLFLDGPTDSLAFKYNNNVAEAMRLDSSGRLLVGTSTARQTGGGFTAQSQVEGAGTISASSFTITSNRSADDLGPRLNFARSKGGALGSNTIVDADAEYGGIYFFGADGTDTDSIGAQISAYVDGTPGANDMPGRIVLATTADGASSPTERMRISSAGDVFLRQAGGAERVYFTSAGSASIGPSAYAASSTTLYIGNAAIQVTSDQRLKRDIANTALDAAEELKKLRVVDFTWDDPSDTSFNNKNARGRWTGILAQELVEVFPFAVNAPRKEEDLSVDYDSKETWTVNQDQLVPVLVKAFQQAMERIETLEGMVAVNNITIDEQQHQLSTLAARLTALESA
jgi:hypothetical protein